MASGTSEAIRAGLESLLSEHHRSSELVPLGSQVEAVLEDALKSNRLGELLTEVEYLREQVRCLRVAAEPHRDRAALARDEARAALAALRERHRLELEAAEAALRETEWPYRTLAHLASESAWDRTQRAIAERAEREAEAERQCQAAAANPPVRRYSGPAVAFGRYA